MTKRIYSSIPPDEPVLKMYWCMMLASRTRRPVAIAMDDEMYQGISCRLIRIVLLAKADDDAACPCDDVVHDVSSHVSAFIVLDFTHKFKFFNLTIRIPCVFPFITLLCTLKIFISMSFTTALGHNHTSTRHSISCKTIFKLSIYIMFLRCYTFCF